MKTLERVFFSAIVVGFLIHLAGFIFFPAVYSKHGWRGFSVGDYVNMGFMLVISTVTGIAYLKPNRKIDK